jgi:hypothetical protein
MSDETPDVTQDDESGLSRRALIKRAAVVGGVVAWTAPTIQMLGQNTAWAASTKKLPPGSATICGDGGAKPTRVRYSWEGGTCVAHPNTCAANCACTDSASCGGATDVVFITLTTGQGTIDQASVTGLGAVWDNAQQVHGQTGDLSFDVLVNGNNEFFTIRTGSHTGPTCQTVQFHVSCSQTPPVQPGYQIGGLLLSDWSTA